MPELTTARELIATARKLVAGDPETVSEADIKRSVSTAYFAVFHALAQVAADCLVGEIEADRPNRAWVEVYRGLSHGPCKEACDKAKSIGFPEEIEGFANTFVQLQYARKRVDYDPVCMATVNEAIQWIEIADVSVERLSESEVNNKIAFSIWVLITSPGAKNARTAVKEQIAPQLGPPRPS